MTRRWPETLYQRGADAVRGWWRRSPGERRLVLAAHGAGEGSAANRTVEAVAVALRQKLGQVPVETAFHLGRPGFASLAGRRDAVVLPLLTSEGWFFRRLANAIGDAPTLLRPIGTDPRLNALLVDTVVERLVSATIDPATVAVLVVGHGTRRQASSGDATRHLAGAMRRALPAARVEAAFLDQDPGLGAVARQLAGQRPVLVVVPFLLGHGQHATADIDAALVGEQAPSLRLTLPSILELPTLPDRLAAVADKALRPTAYKAAWRRYEFHLNPWRAA